MSAEKVDGLMAAVARIEELEDVRRILPLLTRD
jgi:hypothetical protein